MKDKVIAFDDTEVNDWLMDLIEDGSGNFLSAFAEAVVTADAEDYSVTRPGLIELKRKYCSGEHRQVPDPGSHLVFLFLAALRSLWPGQA